MNTTFKNVLETALLQATGGNRGQARQQTENWTENYTYPDPQAECDKHQLDRHIYRIKMCQARKINASV